MVLTDTSKESQKVLNELYRAMTPTRKAELVFSAYSLGRQLAMAGLRQRNPNASDSQIWHLWARQHLGEALYNQVYGTASNEQS
jgi:hypothetical protein